MAGYMRHQNESVLAMQNAQTNAARNGAFRQPTYTQAAPVFQQQAPMRQPTPARASVTQSQTRNQSTQRNDAQPQRVMEDIDSSYGLQGKITEMLTRSKRPDASVAQSTGQTVSRRNGARRMDTHRTAPRSSVAAIGSGVRHQAPTTSRWAEHDEVTIDSWVESDDDNIELAAMEVPAPRSTPAPRRRKKAAKPRVSSHARPVTQRTAARDGTRSPSRQVSVLRDWETQNSIQDDDLGSGSPLADGNDDSSFAPEPDDRVRDDARRARRQMESELDELDDDLDFGLESELDRDRTDEEDELDALDREIDRELEEDDEDESIRRREKSCDEFRTALLSTNIRDISLDISPPASERRFELAQISRTWMDPSGNILGTGTMVDLRRGYVILETGQKIAYARLSEADWAAISEAWLLPTTCSIGSQGTTARNWIPQTVHWKSSGLCHKPLFFENIQLERYGHSHGPFLQPVHSTFHFFKSLVLVPYQNAITPANECQYTLGFYRPGNCAPWLKDDALPITPGAIARQALFVTGAAFIP